MTERVQLEFPDGRPPLTAASDVNTALAEVGAGVWRLDLTGARDNVRELLTRHTVTDEDTERLRANFLLPRERLLEIIAAAGRTPNVEGGGELSTFVTNEGYSYPQLWVVQGNADFSRFDRFHVNTSDDGDIEEVRAPGVDGVLGTTDDVITRLQTNLFQREIAITTLNQDGTTAVNPNLRRITVNVRYRVLGGWRTYTLTTYISNYS